MSQSIWSGAQESAFKKSLRMILMHTNVCKLPLCTSDVPPCALESLGKFYQMPGPARGRLKQYFHISLQAVPMHPGLRTASLY